MKKTLTTIITFVCCSSLFAQSFSTKLYFETAAGEKDTLEIGYDPAGTNGLDAILGEVNYGTPVSPDKFQVFIAPWKLDYLDFYDEEYPFFVKKQIVGVRDGWISRSEIIILCPEKSLPITVSWDKSLFENSPHDTGFITDLKTIAVIDWYEDECTFKYFLKDRDHIVLDDFYVNRYVHNGVAFREIFISLENQERIMGTPNIGIEK